MASGVAKNVYAGQMTSSPGSTPSARSASTRASVPFATPTPWAASDVDGGLALEGRDLRAEDEATGVEDVGGGGQEPLAEVSAHRREIHQGDGH